MLVVFHSVAGDPPPWIPDRDYTVISGFGSVCAVSVAPELVYNDLDQMELADTQLIFMSTGNTQLTLNHPIRAGEAVYANMNGSGGYAFLSVVPADLSAEGI